MLRRKRNLRKNKGLSMTEIDTATFEGCELHVYVDTTGNHTIGIGHNMDSSVGHTRIVQLGLDYDSLYDGTEDLTQEQANNLFQVDYAAAKQDAITLCPALLSMPSQVQLVICDLSFNMGLNVLSTFHYTLAALNRGDWSHAALALKQSKWYTQVGRRGVADVNALLEVANGP
jgi:lysozyme